MKSTDKTLENITGIAVTKVAAVKIPFVVYKHKNVYDYTMYHLRPSNYERILSYEKENVIIKDSQDKLIRKVSTKKEVSVSKELKKTKKAKQEPQENTDKQDV